MNKIKILLMEKMISVILGQLTPELLKSFADHLLDWIEVKVQDSETEIDDRVLLPIIKMIRSTFDIPDDD